MYTDEVRASISPEDIVELGKETGIRVLAMPEYPTQGDIDQVVLDLSLSAIAKVQEHPSITPEGTVD